MPLPYRLRTTAGTFQNGAPAVVRNRYGKGTVFYAGGCPGLAYIKEAKFVPAALEEKWPASVRAVINGLVRESGTARLVELSQPVVEAGIFDAPSGTALVLGNFTYEPIPELMVRLTTARRPDRVVSAEQGPLRFQVTDRAGDKQYPFAVEFALPLGLNDIVMVE